MRLLSCQISGFGKFAGVAFDLSAPIVCVKGDNGWGKTTLADFIGSMFYGLDGGRRQTVSGNDRLRYEPWSGARFGGSLTFTHGGKLYRVERFFGKTAGGDTVKVYDKNNMPCYEFGEKAERLGETLFGVDRESFERTAYIPQGGQGAGALPQDIRSRLLALLSADGDKEGANDTVARLDTAERALRAKRRPAKGKLDEIDDRLAYLQTQKSDCRRAEEKARELQSEAKEYARRLAFLKSETEKLSALAQEYARRSEQEAIRTARAEIESQRKEAQSELDRLDGFFGQADPLTVNTAGLESAIKEFYSLKEEVEKALPEAEEFERRAQEKRALKERLVTSARALEDYELMMESSRKPSATDKKERKKKERKRKRAHLNAGLGVAVALAAALFGAILTQNMPTVGTIVLVLGTLGLLGCGAVFLKTSTVDKRETGTVDEAVKERYLLAKAETDELKKRLSAYPPDMKKRLEALQEAIAKKRSRAEALGTAIDNFLRNFALGEAYDHRASLAKIKENAERYARLVAVRDDCLCRIESFAPVESEFASDGFVNGDIDGLQDKRNAYEREKEELTATLAGVLAQAETQEKRAAYLADIEAEEERLLEEKARLERRLQAVRTARELLVRARHNLASRYLEPVEKTLAGYIQKLGFALPAKARFSADGTPVLEEGAAYRNAEYYSAGIKDMLWFCVRLALVEALYTADPPPILLDDPFVNMDDKTTEKAKSLLRELSKKYQIVYFTCKEERKL